MKDQHEKIKGYRDLSPSEIELMNTCKDMAETMAEAIAEMKTVPTLDQQDISIAKYHFQTGFMWLIRAIAQPTTFG
ncbi:MAG TPA: hypothetical protein VIJ14_08710 [Rhabdochlamydiaceae bacterium]